MSTDVAVNYGLPITRFQVFVRGVVTNVFNQHKITGSATGGAVGMTVNAAGNSSAYVPFNPFTQTPVECPQSTPSAQCKALGANYQLATNFGLPTGFTAYQPARTYSFSVGARF